MLCHSNAGQVCVTVIGSATSLTRSMFTGLWEQYPAYKTFDDCDVSALCMWFCIDMCVGFLKLLTGDVLNSCRLEYEANVDIQMKPDIKVCSSC